MDDGSYKLLKRSGAKSGIVGPECRSWAVTAVGRHGGRQRGLLDAQLALELAQEVGIPFGAYPAEKLEGDDDQGGSDTGSGEHGIVLDVPGA